MGRSSSEGLAEWAPLERGAARQIPGPAPPDGNRRFGFAIVFVLLMGVPALPLPTGGATHVFEVIAVLLALELIAGRDEIWLNRKVDPRSLERVATEEAVRGDVTSTDITLMGALLAQPLSSAPDWMRSRAAKPRSTSRACDRPTGRRSPGMPSHAPELEQSFTQPPRSRPR